MRTNEVLSKGATRDASVARADVKLEAVVVPVTDVDCAKKFHGRLGWLDADLFFDKGFRVVQFTPPGSAEGFYAIASGTEAAREQLVARRVKVGEAFHAATPGAQFKPDGASGRARSRRLPCLRHVQGLDGNGGWCGTSLPAFGRIDFAEKRFASASDPASALRRAEIAHGQHEKRTGQRDANWPDWHAEYMVAGRPARNCRSEMSMT